MRKDTATDLWYTVFALGVFFNLYFYYFIDTEYWAFTLGAIIVQTLAGVYGIVLKFVYGLKWIGIIPALSVLSIVYAIANYWYWVC